jgi:hypothetical protein
MARGTDFGGVHSYRDLHLLQVLVAVEPAKPKTNFINIPGANGSKDFTDLPAGVTTYNTRKITWTFKLYPGDNWAAKYTQVSNALNGRACQITLDADPDHYYVGRVVVAKHAVDGILHTITVEATCQPYKLWKYETTITADLTTSYHMLILDSGRMPVFPEVTVTAGTTLLWQGNTFNLSKGTHRLLDIRLSEGVNLLQAKTTSGTGKITVVYQIGEL